MKIRKGLAKEGNMSNQGCFYNVKFIFSGDNDIEIDCIPSPFICFKIFDSMVVPGIRKYRPRIRLLGKALTNSRVVSATSHWNCFIKDAYRFCESRGMNLFRPDSTQKNLFLAKLSLSIDQPILFDMYRFGNSFEFQYG